MALEGASSACQGFGGGGVDRVIELQCARNGDGPTHDDGSGDRSDRPCRGSGDQASAEETGDREYADCRDGDRGSDEAPPAMHPTPAPIAVPIRLPIPTPSATSVPKLMMAALNSGDRTSNAVGCSGSAASFSVVAVEDSVLGARVALLPSILAAIGHSFPSRA